MAGSALILSLRTAMSSFLQTQVYMSAQLRMWHGASCKPSAHTFLHVEDGAQRLIYPIMRDKKETLTPCDAYEALLVFSRKTYNMHALCPDQPYFVVSDAFCRKAVKIPLKAGFASLATAFPQCRMTNQECKIPTQQRKITDQQTRSRLVDAAFAALDSLHARGFIHSAVCPEHLLVNTDCSAAMLVGHSHWQAGNRPVYRFLPFSGGLPMKTPRYAATFTAALALDRFSLFCTLWQLFAGKRLSLAEPLNNVINECENLPQMLEIAEINFLAGNFKTHPAEITQKAQRECQNKDTGC